MSDAKRSLQTWAGKLDVVQNMSKSAICSQQRLVYLWVAGVPWGCLHTGPKPPCLKQVCDGRRGTEATGFCPICHINSQNVGQRPLHGSLSSIPQLCSQHKSWLSKLWVKANPSWKSLFFS